MTKTEKEQGKKDWFSKIVIVQLVVCVVAIVALFLFFRSGGTTAETIKNDYLNFMSKDFSAEDVSEAFRSVNGYISSFSEKGLGNDDTGNKNESESVSSGIIGGGVDLDFTALDMLEGLCLDRTDIGFEMISPLDNYTVTSNFGHRISPISGEPGIHTGLDMAAGYGTAIHAAADGTVVDAAYDSSYGNYVKIQHENNTVSIYAHCSSLCVKEGTSVRQGDTIAKVGSTGASTGNHLHFEIRKDNIRIDPAYILQLK